MGRQIKQKQDGFVKPMVNPDQFRSRESAVGILFVIGGLPPLRLVFAWALLGEHVAPADLAGIVPVAFGIYLVIRPARPAPHIGKIAPAGAP
jgi:hypothetical protein